MAYLICKCGHVLFTILSLFVCTFWCTIITIVYFKYETSNRVAPIVPVTVRVPSTSFCFSLSTLFSSAGQIDFFDSNEPQRTLKKIRCSSSEQLFKLTLSEEDIFVECEHRNLKKRKMVRQKKARHKHTKCLDHFNTTKYLMQGYVCYKMEHKSINGNKFEFEAIAHSVHHRRLLYMVTIHPSLSSKQKILPIIHYTNYPFTSRTFSQEVIPTIKDNQGTQYTLTYQMFWIDRLPLPHSTACVKGDPAECFYECYDSLAGQFGLRHHAAIVSKPTNASFGTLKYPGTWALKENFHMKDVCSAKCGLKACREAQTITFISNPSRTKNRTLEFRVETTAYANFFIETQANVQFDDFVLQMGSIIGIFFASSIIGVLYLKPHFESEKELLCHFGRNKPIELGYLVREAEAIAKQSRLLFDFLVTTGVLRNKGTVFGRRRMESKVRSKVSIRILKLICDLGVFAGFSYVLISLSIAFFNYKTLMVVTFNFDAEHHPVNLSLCFELRSILDLESYPQPTSDNFDESFRTMNQKFNLTFDELFKRAPVTKEVIVSCRIRNATTNELVVYPTPELCHPHLNITFRYYMSRRICYFIAPLLSESMQVTKVKRALKDPGVLYTVTINSSFSRYYRMTPLVYFDVLPLVSRNHAPDVYFENRNRLYLLSYSMRREERLKSPYDTRCEDDRRLHYCMHDCLSSAAQKISRFPYTEILFTHSDYKVMSYSDLVDTESAKKWKQVERRCDRKCSKSLCTWTVAKTHVSHSYPSDVPLEFAVASMRDPEIESVAQAVISPYKYIYEVLCCLNFWLGLSAVSVDPFLYYLTDKKDKLHDALSGKLLKVQHSIQMANSVMKSIFFEEIHQEISTKKKPLVRRPSKKKCLLILFYIFCSIGCCVHMGTIIITYLSYPTDTDTTTKYERTQDQLDLSICINLLDLLQLDSLEEKKIPFLFDSTPDASHFISRCGYRGYRGEMHPNMSSLAKSRMFLHETNPVTCSQVFNVTKFIMSNFMCYKINENSFEPRESVDARMFNNNKILYYISTGIRVTQFPIVLIVGNGIPYVSAMLATELSIDSSSRLMINYLLYSESCKAFPYDMGNRLDAGHEKCSKDCQLARFKSLKELPYGVVLEHPIDAWFFSNDSFIPFFERTRVRCKRYCIINRNCEKSRFYMSTVVSQIVELDSSHESEFWLKISDSPIVHVEYFALMELPVLILTIGNIIALWFGISVLHLNPVRSCQSITQKEVDQVSLENVDSEVNELNRSVETIKIQNAMLLYLLTNPQVGRILNSSHSTKFMSLGKQRRR